MKTHAFILLLLMLPWAGHSQSARSAWTQVAYGAKKVASPSNTTTTADPLLRDIPKTRAVASRFALIVGNGQYARYKMGLPDVQYAEQDARAFNQYAIRYFGVPSENILYVENATAGVMHSYLERMVMLLEAQNGPCELYYYFAGHGLTGTRAGSFQPAAVDDDPFNLRSEADFRKSMERLAAGGHVRILAITDACFSGQTRQGPVATASRGVQYRAVDGSLPKGVLHLAAAGERQLAFACDMSQHGLFTYCLLNSLRTSNSNMTWKVLWDVVSKEVVDRSIRERFTKQQPVLNGDALYVEQYLKNKLMP